MPHPAALPESLHDAPFSVAAALDLGVTPTRLRASGLERPFWGVRDHRPMERGIRSLACAYRPRLQPGQFYSHWTAAVLLGLRLPPRSLDARIHVGVLAPGRAPRSRGIVGHEFRAPVVCSDEQSGLPVTDAIGTWCDLASAMTVDELVIMADGLVCRQNPVATLAQVQDAVRGRSGQRGARRLRAALELVRPGTDSAPETLLRLLIVRGGLAEPAVNVRIQNRFGALIGLGDLVYVRERVIIEYDGGHHRENERQYNRDIDRLDEFMEDRWRVVRVNKSHFRAPQRLLGRIRTALDESGSPT